MIVPYLDLTKLKIENGIDVHRLKAGTIVLVQTKNNRYKLVKGFKDKYDVSIQGGKHFPEPTDVNFSGSTFGGTMMKIGWIGYKMYMEMYVIDKKSRLTTTGVRAAEIIGDGWNYVFDWGEK
jgi:hypothetical protein